MCESSVSDLEQSLPSYLQESLDLRKKSLAILSSGGQDNLWDCWWCNLYADIGSAEVDSEITHEMAKYLRDRYLWGNGETERD